MVVVSSRVVVMIEPIEYATRDLLEGNILPNKPIFAITGRSSRYFSSVGLFCHHLDNHNCSVFLAWLEPSYGMNFAIDCGDDVSSAKFMEYLFDNYQQYAEWFLFHPEWL